MIRVLVLSSVVAVAFAAEFFDCPFEKGTGIFMDLDECDKYWKCKRGESAPVYCQDGLVFDPKREDLAEPCDYDFKVDCSQRPVRGPPLGSGACLRKNGIFPHEDPEVCDRYYVCIADRPLLQSCGAGLHFNIDTKVCLRPEQAQRGSCTSLPRLGNFTCPQEKVVINGQNVRHPTFPHDEDCAKFYACKDGVVPQLLKCDDGLLFNSDTRSCTDPELVLDCPL